jgi:hypothetical protein
MGSKYNKICALNENNVHIFETSTTEYGEVKKGKFVLVFN